MPVTVRQVMDIASALSMVGDVRAETPAHEEIDANAHDDADLRA
jgi:hypothetical protein